MFGCIPTGMVSIAANTASADGLDSVGGIELSAPNSDTARSRDAAPNRDTESAVRSKAANFEDAETELGEARTTRPKTTTREKTTTHAITTHSTSGRSIAWDQTRTPAEDASNGNQKVPALLPTETVQSVLGIRGNLGVFVEAEPVGTSIRLLPPKQQVRSSPAAKVATAPTTPIVAPKPEVTSDVTRKVDSPARFVTPENAQILGFRKAWLPDVPDFQPNSDDVVLRSPATKLGGMSPAPEATGATAKLKAPLRSSGRESTPSSPDALPAIAGQPPGSPTALQVGDRDYYPAFMAPRDDSSGALPAISPEKNQTLGAPQPAYVPATPFTPNIEDGPTLDSPNLESPTNDSTPISSGQITGSGIRQPEAAWAPREGQSDELESALAPVKSMPALLTPKNSGNNEGDNEGDAETEDYGREYELGQELGQELESDDDLAVGLDSEPSIGLNEPGTAQNRIKESLLDNSRDSQATIDSESESLELIDPPAQRLESLRDETNEKSEASSKEEPPALSAMDIKPLKVDAAEIDNDETDSADRVEANEDNLRSLDSPVELEDVQNNIESLPIGRLSQLDATGRLKNHPQATALESIPSTIARLKTPILRTLQSNHARTERADSRSNWGMMHQIMVYGADTRIIAGGRNYSAIAWMAGNNVCRGSRLMTSVNGKIRVREGTGLQGHQAQFLAVMSLVGVPSTYPLYVGKQRFDIKDLVEVEAAACEEGKELTFTLVGLAHYLETDTTWAGVRGEVWDFERLIAAELSQPVVGAACGGTHRLMAFAHALRKRRLEGQPITGQWLRAEDFLNEFVAYTYSLQNRDGSMSTNWFESREDNGDLKRKVQTTGHMVEFLLTHLPDSQLGDIRLTRAMTFLVNAMGRIRAEDSAVGFRGHALRSLALYHRRMYGIAADYPAPSVAKQKTRRTVRRHR